MSSEIGTLEMDPWLAQLDTTVREVFEGMLGMPCLPSAPDPDPEGRLKVTLRVSGDGELSFSLYFSMASAKAVVIAFAGDETIDWEPLVEDALGEIGNIVIGSLKTKLGYHLPGQLSMPVVSRERRVAHDHARGDSTRDYAFLENKMEIQLNFNVQVDRSDQVTGTP